MTRAEHRKKAQRIVHEISSSYRATIDALAKEREGTTEFQAMRDLDLRMEALTATLENLAVVSSFISTPRNRVASPGRTTAHRLGR